MSNASLFDRVPFTGSCFMVQKRFNSPSISTGIANLGTLKSPATDVELQ